MSPREIRSLFAAAAAVVAMGVFTSCGTGRTTHALPTYEAPLAKTDFQHVRTTAYTHTESDHREYGAHNALGGELHAAGPGIRRAENTVRAISTDTGQQLGYEQLAYSGAPRQPFSLDETLVFHAVQSDVEGTLRNLQAIARDLLDAQ